MKRHPHSYTLLCLSLAHLIFEPKLGLELGLLAKEMNINELFLKLSLSCL